jgi:hypothetical protein
MADSTYKRNGILNSPYQVKFGVPPSGEEASAASLSSYIWSSIVDRASPPGPGRYRSANDTFEKPYAIIMDESILWFFKSPKGVNKKTNF